MTTPTAAQDPALCAEASSARAEPLVATASRVDRWLLVEHRGAWGPLAPPVDRLALPVIRAVTAAAQDGGARLLMIRRPVLRSDPGRWVFAVSSRPGSEQIFGLHVDEDDELIGIRAPYDQGELSEGWTEVHGRMWLVCTHGRHDECCARRGTPVAKAMRLVEPDTVWEASHLGGDRFAANLVLLPEGHYFGRVSPGEAVQLVEDLRTGTLPVRHWRGRSSLPLPTQAAQSFARYGLGRKGFDDLVLVTQADAGTDVWRVVLADGEKSVEVVVRYVRDIEPALLTCDAPDAKVAARFGLVSLSLLT